MEKQSKLREQIIERYAEGEPIARILKSLKVKFALYLEWRRTFPEFDAAIHKSQESYIETKLSDLEDVLDRYPNPQQAKVYSDNLRWQLSKLDPARFGDRLDINSRHTIDLTDAYSRALQRLQRPMRDLAPQLEAKPLGIPPVYSVATPDNESE